MMLKEFLIEAAYQDVKSIVDDTLMENINDYLSIVLAQLKAKNTKNLDVDHIAKLFTGLTLIGSAKARAKYSSGQVGGFDLNDKDKIFDVLNLVSKTGKDPSLVKTVFDKLSGLNPGEYEFQKNELADLTSDEEPKRQKAIGLFQRRLIKISQFFNHLKTAVA